MGGLRFQAKANGNTGNAGGCQHKLFIQNHES
jgi:hypothetical protein